jgi:L-serine dehydratase
LSEIYLANLQHGPEYHPNTAEFFVKSKTCSTTVLGSSVGGGRVIVFSIDGFKTELSGDYNTIMTIHKDRPGIIAKVASFLAERKVNIARMRVSRESKAEQALMIIEMDEDIPSGLVPSLEAFEDIHKVVAIKRQ